MWDANSPHGQTDFNVVLQVENKEKDVKELLKRRSDEDDVILGN